MAYELLFKKKEKQKIINIRKKILESFKIIFEYQYVHLMNYLQYFWTQIYKNGHKYTKIRYFD